MSFKTILVTGGAGFIGIHLVNRLLKDKEVEKVIIVDNKICSNLHFDTILKRWKEEFCDKIDFIEMDISSPKFYEEICITYEKIHEIYHLASIASPIFYKKHPLRTLDTSYLGSKNVFHLTKCFKSKCLIASTSEVYGDPEKAPQSEDYFGNVNCYGYRSCYDEGKRIMETLAFEYQKEYKCDIKIARIFNTYGPYMNIEDGRIIPSLIQSFLKKTPIQIFNGGNQTRCFNYIDDTLDGLFAFMKSEYKEPVNIGNDKEYTIWETYEKMKDIFMNDFPQYYEELPVEMGFSDKDDPKIRCPDLKRAKEILQYEIKTPFELGIHKTIQYFIQHLS
jgi:UDP-glucuronate decarboxylase